MKRIAVYIYLTAKSLFLLVSCFVGLGLVFLLFPVVGDGVKASIDSGHSDAAMFPVIYLAVGFLWVIVFYAHVWKRIRPAVDRKEPSAFPIVGCILLSCMASFLAHRDFGWDWWAGGTLLFGVLGGIGTPLYLLVLAGRRRRRYYLRVWRQDEAD